MKNEIEISKDGYLAFDAITMKQLIKKTLTESGAFTDQEYEGSYITNIINIVSYSYGALMFYLNKTSNESMFTEAQLYENMNRIVKMIGYNPIGVQTSLLSFSLNAINYQPGLYVIPRYSYFSKQSIDYSFNEDVYFNVTTTGNNLNEVISRKVLYQGRFFETPLFTSTGESNEIFILSTENILIDHFNIHVYVFNDLLKTWEQWQQTDNLFLETPSSKKFELRITPDQNYEIKFGDNINGLKLNKNDKVAVYYLRTSGSEGEVAANVMNGASFVRFTTNQYQNIYSNIKTAQSAKFAIKDLILTHSNPSSRTKEGESANEMRASAPSLFKTQYRLVTKQDFASFIRNNFSNIIQDVAVINNMEYISQYLKYYYNNGITSPDKTSTFLLPQVNFSTPCNFNNIYIICMPILPTGIINTTALTNLTLGQKQSIYNRIENKKTITTEVILIDPVYITVTLGIVGSNNAAPSQRDIPNSGIGIILDGTRNQEDVKQEIQKIFKEQISPLNSKLGNAINITNLSNTITQLPGISKLYTINKSTGAAFPGLNFYAFDRVFPNNIISSNRQLQAKSFQSLFFENIDNIINNIVVIPAQSTSKLSIF